MWGSPLTGREISWAEGGLWKLGREHSKWQAGQTNLHRRPQPEMCLLVCMGAGCCNLGFGKQTEREDCHWLPGASLRWRE